MAGLFGALGSLFGGGGGLNAMNQVSAMGQPQQAFQAAMVQQFTADMAQAQTIYTQIAADAQKQRMERFKIMADLQTKIFEITQDITLNKAKTADKAYQQMDAYIKQ